MKLTVVSPEIKRLSIEMVIQLVFRKIDSEPHIRSLFDDLSGSDPETKKEMKQARIRTKLANFCHDEKIIPVREDGSIASFYYEGDAGQDKEFYISTEEFKFFVCSYGIDVSFGGIDSLVHLPIDEYFFSKPISIRLSPGIPLLSPGENTEESWGDEAEEAHRTARNKARLKKTFQVNCQRRQLDNLLSKLHGKLRLTPALQLQLKRSWIAFANWLQKPMRRIQLIAMNFAWILSKPVFLEKKRLYGLSLTTLKSVLANRHANRFSTLGESPTTEKGRVALGHPWGSQQ